MKIALTILVALVGFMIGFFFVAPAFSADIDEQITVEQRCIGGYVYIFAASKGGGVAITPAKMGGDNKRYQKCIIGSSSAELRAD